ncbi:nitroreductase [bacterium]|nr:nitroreductase [bacterium]
MELKEAIRNRRSIYTSQFSGEPIDQATIEEFLELANWAPTHKHTEPWRFVVYEGEALSRAIDQIKEIYIKETPSEYFNHAQIEKWDQRKTQISHIIAVVMKRHEFTGIPEFEETAAVSMAVQNMWLATAEIDDIGGYWSTPSMVLSPEFANFLELGENERCLGLFILGKISDRAIAPQGKRKDWREKVRWYKI